MEAEWKSRLLQRLNNKTQPGGPVCPLCGHKQFSLLDGVMTPAFPPDFQPNVVRLGGPALPMVVLTCTHCGWTAQIAARVLDPDFPYDKLSATPTSASSSLSRAHDG